MSILSKKGLKSIIYSGEGEPLLNKNSASIFTATKKLGIAAAVSTNGVLLTKEQSEECLKALSWIRFSVSGAANATYEYIHKAKQGDLQKIFSNLQSAVKVKRDQHLHTTSGAQMLLLSENKAEIFSLAKILREIGVDYLTIKPFFQHPHSNHIINVDYYDDKDLCKELKQYETEHFKIYFRNNSIKNLKLEKEYQHCYGLNFMTHMDCHGDVFPCCVFVENKDICYGNIYKENFDEFWESEKSKRIRNFFNANFIKINCRKICRLDEMNKYLHK